MIISSIIIVIIFVLSWSIARTIILCHRSRAPMRWRPATLIARGLEMQIARAKVLAR